MFGLPAKRTIAFCWTFLLSCLLLIGLSVSSLYAQDVYYVNSPDTDLNVRREPGTEYEVVTRLPHGTPVFVQDRHRMWLKIVAPELGLEGWVLQRYLATQPPSDPPTPGELNQREERERFERLKREGIIQIQNDQSRDHLYIRMNHFIWNRFNRHQQQNFLERASRLYQAEVVELRDHRGIARSRLTSTGGDTARFESLNTDD